MGRFQPGNPRPSNSGRKAGTPNKKTLNLQEALKSKRIDVIAELGQLLPQLKPEKRTDVLMDLLSYLFPKRKAIEHQIEYEPSTDTQEDEGLSEDRILAKTLELTKKIQARIEARKGIIKTEV